MKHAHSEPERQWAFCCIHGSAIKAGGSKDPLLSATAALKVVCGSFRGVSARGASPFQLAGQPRRECGKRKVSVGLSPQRGVARGAQLLEQQLVCEGWVGAWACLGVGGGQLST